MGLLVYSTLSRRKEEFVPREGNLVRMYVCGPNVYGPCHVGHAMSYLVFDMIKRYLEYRGYQVTHVQNFTDIEDRIIETANSLGVSVAELAEVCEVLARSRFIPTEPVGPPGQPTFVNGAVLVRTSLAQDGLRTRLKDIEHRLGRVRTDDKFAPRTIDLDLVVWNGQIVNSDVQARPFLQELVREVMPEATI